MDLCRFHNYLVRLGMSDTDPYGSHRSNRSHIPGKRSLLRSLTICHSLHCHQVTNYQKNRGEAGSDGEESVFDVHIEIIANGGDVVKYYSETQALSDYQAPQVSVTPVTGSE
jgi:hypothetical protein